MLGVSGKNRNITFYTTLRARTNGEKRNLKTKPKTNQQTFEFSGETRMEYKRRIRVTKAKVRNENESTVEVEHQHSCTAVQLRQRRRPALKNEGSVPTRLADDTLLLQGRRYPEARDLRWTKYGCCSNSIMTCYNRRFLNVQQYSIR